jgi:hypothetical protein
MWSESLDKELAMSSHILQPHGFWLMMTLAVKKFRKKIT